MRVQKVWPLYIPLILFGVLLPSFFAHALPPPELLLSIPQVILNTLGALTATLVIVASTIGTFFKTWTATVWGRRVFFGIIGFTIIIVVISGIALYNQWKLDVWKQDVNTEIRDLWAAYAPVYSAASEEDARYDIETNAQWVTWSEFESAVGDREYIIIDIRDTYPYEVGHTPGSRHMRLAELLRGDWQNIEEYKDKPVLIICYLGTTGAIASQFLENQGFTEMYQLENGISESVFRDNSLPFEGSAYLPRDERNRNRMSVEQVQRQIEKGAEIIDLRFPDNYEEEVPFSVNHQFFRERATQEEIDEFVQNLDRETSYVMLCKGSASCYSARMLLHDLDINDRIGVGMINMLAPRGETI